MVKSPGLKKHPSGMTLTEIAVAAAIISVVFIAFLKTFGGVSKAIQYTKFRSLASNLAQEQVQLVKQLSYHKVLVTTSTAYLSEFDPDVPYDTGYYPAETLNEGGITFTRYTHVQLARENSGTGEIDPLGPGADTGMKLVLVTVAWNQGSERKKIQVRSIASNPDTVMANATISGNVQSSLGVNLQSAQVGISENSAYAATTGSNGNYSLSVSPGDYTLVATMPGYFPKYLAVSVGANGTASGQNFSLVAMATGVVRGTAWINDHLVLSRVVGSSESAWGVCQEYVEIFNPTTWTWTVNGGAVGLKFRKPGDSALNPIGISYTAASIAPGGFYLFANTTSVRVAGTTVTADAVWDVTPGVNDTGAFPFFTAATPNVIPVNGSATCEDGNSEGAGGLELYSSAQTLDRFGWDRNNGSLVAPIYETDGYDQNIGFQLAEQYYRYSSTDGYNAGWGPAYDSGNNNADWGQDSSLSYAPRNTTSILPVVSGVPAVGAVVTSEDGLSSGVQAALGGAGTSASPYYAEFQLTSVATGTWKVFVSSGSLTREVSDVAVAAGNTAWIPGAGTTPAEPAAGVPAVLLSEEATVGFVSGWVKNAVGAPISPAIQVTNSVNSPVSANTATGNYLLTSTVGTFDITANPNNADAQYVSDSSQAVVVQLGQVHPNVNFTLSRGGKIQGRVTRDGTNAIVGVGVAAFDSNGNARDQQVTGDTGFFTFINLSTGVYSIEPVLGSGELSTPASVSTTVVAGQTISVGTFTITGAYGTISGVATSGGQPIQTGILVVASTATITSLPTLSSNTLTGAAWYITNTREDGTYELDVRGSTVTSYNMAAFYTTFNNLTPSISTQTASSVSVTAGNTTTRNFSW